MWYRAIHCSHSSMAPPRPVPCDTFRSAERPLPTSGAVSRDEGARARGPGDVCWPTSLGAKSENRIIDARSRRMRLSRRAAIWPGRSLFIGRAVLHRANGSRETSRASTRIVHGDNAASRARRGQHPAPAPRRARRFEQGHQQRRHVHPAARHRLRRRGLERRAPLGVDARVEVPRSADYAFNKLLGDPEWKVPVSCS